jgi:hypothetical protein
MLRRGCCSRYSAVFYGDSKAGRNGWLQGSGLPLQGSVGFLPTVRIAVAARARREGATERHTLASPTTTRMVQLQVRDGATRVGRYRKTCSPPRTCRRRYYHISMKDLSPRLLEDGFTNQTWFCQAWQGCLARAKGALAASIIA